MKANIPEIVTVKPIKVLTVHSKGDPNVVMVPFMKALYGTAYGLKMKVYKPKGIVMEIGSLIGRWPDAHLKPKSEWHGYWGLPVPEYVREEDIIQKDPSIEVKLETWDYNTVAQILHLGEYTAETENIQKLHAFISDQGYKIAGVHEEVYMTRPTAKVKKTIIRYPITRQ